MENKIAFIIGFRLPDGTIEEYRFGNKILHNATIEEGKAMLEHIEKYTQNPKNIKYEIFKLV